MIPREKLAALSDQALRDLNRAIVDEIRERQRIAGRVKMEDFPVGSKAKFLSKHGRWVTIEVTRRNDKTISGREIGPDGSKLTQWRVSPQLLQAA